MSQRPLPGALRVVSAGLSVALCWGVVLLAVVVGLVVAGASWQQSLGYLAAWVIGSTLPGVLVWRALAGHSTAPRELGFGAVLGIALQLAFWAIGTAVQRPAVMWLLPVGTAAAFVAVPGLRQHWWPTRAAACRTPLRWHLAMMLVVLLALLRLGRRVLALPGLPPTPSVLSADVWYNSALAYEVDRTLTPQDPFALGEPLRYHWFADAHVAATARLGGVPIVDAMVSLWLVPMLLVVLLAVAAAAQHLLDRPPMAESAQYRHSDVRRWWVGPVAAFFTLVSPALWLLGRPILERVGDGFVRSSPSGILATALLLCLTGPVADIARGRGRRGTWVVLAVLLTVSAGTKPSLLPLVAGGAFFLLLVELIGARRLHRPMLAVLGLAVGLIAASYPWLAGSTSGSRFQLFAIAQRDASYRQLLDGRTELPGAGGWLLPALAQRLPSAVAVVAMLVLLRTLSEAPRLLAVAGLGSRPVRRDPATVWAGGVLATGYLGLWSISHPGLSQHYFWTIAVALATASTVANAVYVLPAAQRGRQLVLPLAACALLGTAAAAAAYAPAVDVAGPVRDVVLGRLRPYAIVLAGLVLTVLLTLLARRVARRYSPPLLTAITAFALAVSLPAAAAQLSEAPRSRPPPASAVGRVPFYVSAEQQRAATWLRQNSAKESVVATNMVCWPMGTSAPRCRHYFMWLSGISGRRLVLGDWTYTTASMRRYDATVAYTRLPVPFPQRVSLVRAVVTAPTRQLLDRLRTEFDAGWLFVDRRATPVSPELAGLADLRYRSTNIDIYRLRERYR